MQRVTEVEVKQATLQKERERQTWQSRNREPEGHRDLRTERTKKFSRGSQRLKVKDAKVHRVRGRVCVCVFVCACVSVCVCVCV